MYYDTKFDPYEEPGLPEELPDKYYYCDIDDDFDYDFYDRYFDEYYDDGYGFEEDEDGNIIGVRRKKHRWLRSILVSLLVTALVVSACAGVYLALNYDLHFEARGAGASVALVPKGGGGIADEGYTEPQQPVNAPASQVKQAPLGDGTTLNVSPLPSDDPLSNQEVFRSCAPSIVSIDVLLADGMASGTGVIMSEDGYIITNSHVIEDGLAISVTANDTEYEAALVGHDAQTDLAVLKIDAQDLSPAEFGDSGRAVVGDEVVAIGNPLGQNLTMTKGIVSGIDRSVTANGYTMTLLQTSAQINSGNSGGALINMYGQVIGITNLKLAAADGSVEGIGFAIPVAVCKQVVDSIIERGYVSGRPALGVTVRGVSSVAAAYYNTPAGVLIVSVSRNSDAYNQGLREGDLITHALGQPIDSTEELREMISAMRVGDVISLTVYRDGETFDVGVTLVESALVSTAVSEEESGD